MAQPELTLSPQVPTSSEASEAIHRTIAEGAERYDEIRLAQALSRDDERKRDLDLDEISDEVGLEVVDAGVRGSGSDENRRVIYVYADENGRTHKGVVAYSRLPRSIRAFEERRATEVDAAKAARSRGGSAEAFGEDPRVETLSAEIERLRAAARERPAAPVVPEPFEGFKDASVSDVVVRIAAVEDPVEREFLKRDVRRFEESLERPRKGVLAACEPARLVAAADDE